MIIVVLVGIHSAKEDQFFITFASAFISFYIFTKFGNDTISL